MCGRIQLTWAAPSWELEGGVMGGPGGPTLLLPALLPTEVSRPGRGWMTPASWACSASPTCCQGHSPCRVGLCGQRTPRVSAARRVRLPCPGSAGPQLVSSSPPASVSWKVGGVCGLRQETGEVSSPVPISFSPLWVPHGGEGPEHPDGGARREAYVYVHACAHLCAYVV